MKVIKARNAQQALPEALYQIQREGVRRDSRNGPVLKFPTPTTIQYTNPTERVVFWADRDANPFFHLMESLWMLAGRNDVAFVSGYVARMATFSDDGQTFHGAYGYRWRQHFGFDQLNAVVKALKANPDDRRCVVQMWSAQDDLGREGKDFPCNIETVFSINEGRLDMTVYNRSNDLVWGALGANCVHFSVLQEYMAGRIGVPVGQYWQVSNNMHLYLETHGQLMENLAAQAADPFVFKSVSDPYEKGVETHPLMSTDPDSWESELFDFMEDPLSEHGEPFLDPFFREVAVPMARAHRAYKTNKGQARFDLALAELANMAECDWKLAAEEWLARRHASWARAADDGVEY